MAVKKAKFSRYDVTEYLKSKEELAAYLDACMEEAGDDAVDSAKFLTSEEMRDIFYNNAVKFFRFEDM